MSSFKPPPRTKVIDLRRGASDPSVFSTSYTQSTAIATPFHVYSEDFLSILGDKPDLTVFAEDTSKLFAHESGIYIPSTNEIFFTSNQIIDEKGNKSISLYKLNISQPGKVECLDSTEGGRNTIMLNGGTNHPDGGLIFCQQGNLQHPSAIVYMSSLPPYQTSTLVNNFNGRNFNSVNDVVVHMEDGSIWFTDPAYGNAGGWRPEPDLPPVVYAFQPQTGEIRVVADGFFRPNGITFSPDYKRCYVTDTGAGHGDGYTFEWGTKPATVYVFDVETLGDSGSWTLANRRVFAHCDKGFPDGIKCDTEGNVYSGCGDGIHAWNPSGRLIGKIAIGEPGCGNLVFGPPGTLFIFAETRIYRVDFAAEGAPK